MVMVYGNIFIVSFGFEGQQPSTSAYFFLKTRNIENWTSFIGDRHDGHGLRMPCLTSWRNSLLYLIHGFELNRFVIVVSPTSVITADQFLYR